MDLDRVPAGLRHSSGVERVVHGYPSFWRCPQRLGKVGGDHLTKNADTQDGEGSSSHCHGQCGGQVVLHNSPEQSHGCCGSLDGGSMCRGGAPNSGLPVLNCQEFRLRERVEGWHCMGKASAKLDIPKPFDTLCRSTFLKRLKSMMGNSQEFRCWVRMFQDNVALLTTPWNRTEVGLRRGVKQGAVESPTIFGKVVDGSFRTPRPGAAGRSPFRPSRNCYCLESATWTTG